MDISIMLGKVMKSVVTEQNEKLIFTDIDDVKYTFLHNQSCCENVTIDDICGELDWLVGEPLLTAEESTNSKNPKNKNDESFTWTFYKFSTKKGYVDIKWYGASNGFYSESVNLYIGD